MKLNTIIVEKSSAALGAVIGGATSTYTQFMREGAFDIIISSISALCGAIVVFFVNRYLKKKFP